MKSKQQHMSDQKLSFQNNIANPNVEMNTAASARNAAKSEMGSLQGSMKRIASMIAEGENGVIASIMKVSTVSDLDNAVCGKFYSTDGKYNKKIGVFRQAIARFTAEEEEPLPKEERTAQ